ncbi:MAG: transketolase [Promethearchaeota archaeon]
MLSREEEKEILFEILDIKKDILRMIYLAGSGHPGGSLSCVTLLYLLYTRVLNLKEKDKNKRDIFILSKGHAAPALYAVLSRVGLISNEELFTLRQFNSRLQGHPIRNRDLTIEITTGSLGMGLSVGIGCSLGAKLDGETKKKIYVLLGDGELDEGVIWEAAMAANHFKLDNLIAIIDRNGLQIDGNTEEIMPLEPLAEKWRAFGWHVIELDGSNLNQILEALNSARNVIKKPTVLISYLVKGADISFMEHVKKYHGRPPTLKEYEEAIRELNTIQNQLKNQKE